MACTCWCADRGHLSEFVVKEQVKSLRFAALPIWEQVESFRVLSGFSKSAGKWLSRGSFVRPEGPSLETGTVLAWPSDFIFADGAWDVCEGDHWLDVMNPWDALTMKIRYRRFGRIPPLFQETGERPVCPHVSSTAFSLCRADGIGVEWSRFRSQERRFEVQSPRSEVNRVN